MPNPVGRPRQGKRRVEVMLTEDLLDILAAIESNRSVFLEKAARSDERVVTYITQGGECKQEGCNEPISETSVYCGISNEEMKCPAWWCGYHYEQTHLPPDEIDEIDEITGMRNERFQAE